MGEVAQLRHYVADKALGYFSSAGGMTKMKEMNRIHSIVSIQENDWAVLRKGIMQKASWCLLPVVAIGVLLISGCGGASAVTTPPVIIAAPASAYQIVSISDLHFNPLYDSSLFSQLVANDPSQWEDIFGGSTVTAPSGGGADTNYPLLRLTMVSMNQNMANSPVVLFTGDLLGHNIPQNYCKSYLTLNNDPVNANTVGICTASQSAAIDQFIDKTFKFVASEIQTAVGSNTVIYAPGNIDTYAGSAGPDPSFLADNEAIVYNLLLEQDADPSFTTTFPSGGYYFSQLQRPGVRVIALNSNSFVSGSPTYNNASTELQWLSQQLQSAQAQGQKVWILMHVPPGVNSQSTAQVAAVPSDVDASNVSMMWDSGLQSTFISTLQQYPGVVTLMLAGHTHMDEFRILPTGDVLEQLPGISPCFGNNPTYKVITIRPDTLTATDYQSIDYNLATMPSQFGTLYQFSSTYGFNSQSNLGNSLTTLYPLLNSTESDRDIYTLLYTSGSESVNPLTYAPWNPINDVNWPLFGCTIGNASQSDYLTCLNTY
jgi:hypothetical protein